MGTSHYHIPIEDSLKLTSTNIGRNFCTLPGEHKWNTPN
jgi:hypothetical protein